MTPGGFRGGSVRSGLANMLLYLAKILLFVIPIAVAALVTAGALGWDLASLSDAGGGSGSGQGVSARTVLFAVVLLLLMVLSFMAGFHARGSAGRLVSRLALNVCLAVAIIMVAQGIDYAAGDLVLSEHYSVMSQGLVLSLEVGWLMAPLLLIPVFSAADAYLEYRGAAGPWSILRGGGE